MKLVHSSTTTEVDLKSRSGVRAIGSVGTGAGRGQLVTVVSFRGEIDASDIDPVTAFAVGSALLGNAVLLDLRGVEFFAVQGISLLNAVERTCRGLDLPWILLASTSVDRLLRVSGQANALPLANSVAAAMQYFAYFAFLSTHPRSTHDLLPIQERTSDQSQ